MNKLNLHYEENVIISDSASAVFDYADDHKNFSAHMNQSSRMTFGGRMNTQIDSGEGKKVGSHIRMSGRILGVKIFLDEIITDREPPFRKEWKTLGDLRLIVIGHYKMGFEIKPKDSQCQIKIYIDYELPESFYSRWIGYVLGKVYAKWCVVQMINKIKENFDEQTN